MAKMRVFLLFCIVLCFALSAANENTTSNGVEKESKNDVEAKEDEKEKVETFQEFEKRMKQKSSDLIRRILPQMMKGASDSKISGNCMSSLMKLIGGIRQLKEWAIRFVDATGKIPPGILEGTSLSLGDYDECLDIKVGKKESPPEREQDLMYSGQYCLLESHRPEVLERAIQEYRDGNMDAPIAKSKTILNIFVRYKHLRNSTFKVGACIPSTCTTDDLQKVLDSEAVKSYGNFHVAYCKSKEQPPLTTDQYIILGILGFIGGCLVLGTAADVFLRIFEGADKQKKPEKKSVAREVMEAFSIYSNALDLVHTKDFNEPLRVLCALRFITVSLTIYSHSYGHIHELHFQKFSKPANFLRFFESFTFAGIANGSVGMDSIVFLAAVTIAYTRWRNTLKKESVNLGICSLLIKRYCRMSAAQLLVIALFLLYPIFGNGPLWSAYIDRLVDDCKARWWLNILYVSNFWSSRITCIYHTWVLAVIMQLTVLSIVILFLLKRSPKYGIGFSVLLILAGIVGVAVATIIHDLPGSMAFYMLDLRTAPLTWRRVYTLAYDHVGPFCIGLLTGYYLAVKRDTLNISRKVCILLWITSCICNSAVLFGLYPYRRGEKMGLSLATFYAVTHRNVWTMGIAWLVIACTTGHAGVVGRFLNANIFISLDRLCYMAFLVHLPIMFYHSGVIRERWFMGHFELMFFAFGYIGLSYIVSAWLYVTCVKPFYFIESKIASYCGGIFKKTEKLHNHRPSLSFSTNGHLTTISNADSGCVNVGFARNLDNF